MALSLLGGKLLSSVSSHCLKVKILSCVFVLTATRKFSNLAGAMKAVVVDEHGGPEKLLVRDLPKPTLENDRVLIRVYASAINRADCLQRAGMYAVPKGESKILGLEASGIVEAVGLNVSKFGVGDRVMALLGGGGYAEYVSVNQAQVMKIPPNMDFITAASIPEVWITAYQLLHFVGKVQTAEKILIHAGGSGVGTALVQLCKIIGGTTFVTAGTTEKLETAKELGASFTINYKDQDFSEIVLAETGGRGVNLILDPVGASYWEKNIKSLAMDGRWVLYGLLGGAKIDGPILVKLLEKRAQLLSSTLRPRSLDYKGELVAAFARDVLPRFSTGELKSIIDTTYALQDIADAHRHMEASKNIGKIVIKVRESQSHDEL